MLAFVLQMSGLFQRSTPPSLASSITQFNPRHIAEELAVMDGEMLRQIRIEEFKDCAWMKKNKVRIIFSSASVSPFPSFEV